MGERRIALLVQQIRKGDVAAADTLPEALAELPPTESSRVLVRRLLDQRTLDGRADSFGVSCRAALIAAQLDQGYPWALEVPPDDVAWMRTQVGNRDAGVNTSRAWTITVAVPSLVWNIGWTLVLLIARTGWFVPFVIGALHAGWALATAWSSHARLPREKREFAARSYRVLASLAALGPLASFLAATDQGEHALVLGMLFALPAMATAFVCLPASERILPEAR